MMEPLADRLLDALGDPVARHAIRVLLNREMSQSELVGELGVAQPTLSRAVKLLRNVGLVAAIGGGRAPQLTVTARDAALALLLASDRLAENVLELESRAQREQSDATRRSAVRPAQRRGNRAGTEQNGA
jgi:DNA-binding transcriptional ArsR family regulator